MNRNRPLSICYYTATGMELPCLSEAVLEYRDKIGPLTVTARTQTQLFDNSRQHSFVTAALQHDVIILSLHGGQPSCPAFDLLMEELASAQQAGKNTPYLHIQPTDGDEDSIRAAKDHSPDFGTKMWDTIKRYLRLGGYTNYEQLLYFLYNHLRNQTVPCNEPTPHLHEGIYHPDINHDIDLTTYLEQYIDPDKITVGLWFYQTYWLNNNVAYIDAIIRAVEAQGANVIPVFHLRYKDVERGNNGADYIVEEYFMEAKKPRIDVLISPMLFSLSLASPDYSGLLKKLGVVCIQAMVSMGPYQAWRDSDQGMQTMDVSFNAAQPEFDGNLITVPVATREQETIDPITGGLLNKYLPIPERVDKMVRLSLNWARLRKIPNKKRRVAIIFHHYPPRNDRIGCAAGLDSFASVKALLEQLQDQGYEIETTYDSGDQLAEELLSHMTADQRWLTPEKMAERSTAHAGPSDFLAWHRELPEDIQKKMNSDWQEMPGDLFVHEGKLHFAGFVNGNIFISIQPPRGNLENVEQSYHDMHLSPPHHYLAHYRWIRDVFKADAVIHVGKHGSLEWLPGKALGLSEKCYPDLAIMELPNIYPYIINDPSEGTQAKRRSYACIIDHLTPVYTNADLYEDLSQLNGLLEDYSIAAKEDTGKIAVLRPMIWEAVYAAELHQDLEITQEEAMADFDLFLEKLHSYLHELSDTMINDGLHTLGSCPQEESLIELLAQLTRIANGDTPSLREAVIGAMGHDYDQLLEKRGKVIPKTDGKTGGQLIGQAHELILLMLCQLAETGFDSEKIPEIIFRHLGTTDRDVETVLSYVSEILTQKLSGTKEELTATLTALSGYFVQPGPSGSPTRGQADILPTGRNFYSVDPNKIPSPAAWEVGKQLGDALIERYLQEKGEYPDSIGILIYGGPTMRTRGDDIAEIYYLMGLKPVWHKSNGNVVGLEVIPLDELKRPRLDVVPRVSGFFRDAFPNLMERIDEAVAIVAALKEPPESNMLRRNVLADIETLKDMGMDHDEALREATFRVFSCPPGTYGAGVSELVESKNWETQEDLARSYINYSSHAYGKTSYGIQKPETFKRLLSRMEVTVKNEDSREYDMMSCTDYYNYYGGLIVAAKTERGELPFAVMGDSSDPKRVKMRTTFEEAKHILRSRLVNPKWLEGMKRHGYKGAGDISHMMDVVLGWDATGEVIDDWMYTAVAKKYALDPEMQEWMKEVNPYAMQNILDKLLEAIQRGMWQADKEMEEELRDQYLEMEGEIEERIE